MILKDYAESNSYILAASYGVKPNNTHYYFVSSNFSDSIEITEKIQKMDYIWYLTGELSINYAI